MLEGLKITKAQVSRELQYDVIETAIEAGHTHGIGYWATLVRTVQNIDNRTRSMTLEDREGATDGEQPKRYVIGGPAIATAIEKLLTDPKGCDAEGWAARLLDKDGLDGPLADAIVQVACFGKVIYG